MSDSEYSVIMSDVIKSFDCISGMNSEYTVTMSTEMYHKMLTMAIK